MDKTGIFVISLCVLLLGWWFVEQNKMAKEQALYNAAHPVTSIVVGSNSAASTTTTSTANGKPVSAPIFAPDAKEVTLVLTNGRARYTFTSFGGGLRQVELLDYPQTISARWKDKITNSAISVATLNAQANVPVLAVLGDDSLIGDGNFALSHTGNEIRAEKNLPDGVRLVKTFSLSSNFLVNATVRLENTSDKTILLPAQELVVGTATPMDADDTALLEGAIWFDGTNTQDQAIALFAGGGGCTKSTPKTEFRAGSGNVVWAAAHNQFFTLLAMPKEPAREMHAQLITLPRFQNVGTATNNPAPQGVQTMLVYAGQTLAANAVLERQITIFAGPKEYRTLVRVGEQLNNHADQVMNFGSGFATFWGVGTFFAKMLLSAMNALHDLTRLGYGWVIVLITVLIKLLFWPLTKASTLSMKRMAALAPKLNELKEKYKDDVQKLTAKQWELYKENKVNPMSGCLPMLVQMPVFIGFFTMIRSAIELRGAHFLWAADLSKPDTLFMIPGITFLPFISTPDGLPFNLLPILMGAAMLWQSHLTPASPGMDPAQAKMMRWLPAIFILFLYNYSSGLALYWTVNNVLTIVQTKITNATLVKLATAATIVDVRPKKKK
jgi:YidC/Oxa1 family membrane protein insertase